MTEYTDVLDLINKLDFTALERAMEIMKLLSDSATTLDDAIYFLENVADDRCAATHVNQEATATQLGKLLRAAREL